MQPTDLIAKWQHSSGAERANKDSFLNDLCDVLSVARPDPTTGDAALDLYVFEKDVVTPHADKTASIGKVDLYKHGAFLLEAKQGSNLGALKVGTAKRGTPAWHQAMQQAQGQALGYARNLPSPPPFLIVCDIGHCFELYASFDGSSEYRPFPAAPAHRLFIGALAEEKTRELLRLIWTDPLSLDPARNAAKVTGDVAEHLAELARSLETAGHAPESVAKFLMRCLFTMFAEDVGLLPADPTNGERLFTMALEKVWLPNPLSFPAGIESLWAAMNEGKSFGFAGRLLRFNGGLFAQPTSLPLSKDQLGLLLEAAKCNWSDVEPTIFGTLLERALNPKERHALGAHYTPRAYVERLIRPTIEEPLRADWDLVRGEVMQLVDEAKLEPAKKALRAFHQKLAATRVLDPACGSGNFLYVALDLLLRLEDEVIDQLAALGETQQLLAAESVRVTPSQFHGIEVKPWAKEIAELVLWIGYLQHYMRLHGKASPPPEPVLQDYKNIECRDAVLAWDDQILQRDEHGKPVTRWDGETMKISPVTGEKIPDESARVPVYKYVNPRKAEWPEVDFIVGNPPFVGTKRMRTALGDGYVDAVRSVFADSVEDNADFVMLWWDKAAHLAEAGSLRGFGLITTNSITQTFNRRVVRRHLGRGLRIVWAIPDHPWSDSDTGAAVRIAMTCVEPASERPAVLGVVTAEYREGSVGDGSAAVVVDYRAGGVIHEDLRVGADVAGTQALRANGKICALGVALHGSGFLLNAPEAEAVRVDGPEVVRRFISGRDLLQDRRDRYVIDFSGMSEDEARIANPSAFQHLMDHVLPERRLNRRDSIRRLWWRFGWERPLLRAALQGLPRFIATPETAKHRVFQFIESEYLPEHRNVVIASDDALVLGMLSTRAHVTWALRAGGTLEDRPVYNKTLCFDPFPFPACNDLQAQTIRGLSEKLDAHRKAQQAKHADLTVTGMYNVLEKLRAATALGDKDKVIHDQGLVSILKQIHDALDAAVFAAYGWPADLTDEQILEKLVALNAERAEEERNGLVRWLRPEFQNPGGQVQSTQTALVGMDEETEATEGTAAATVVAWPKKVPEQLAAVRDLVLGTSGAWTTAQVAKAFKGATPKVIQTSLQSLAALGLLVRYESDCKTVFQAAVRSAA